MAVNLMGEEGGSAMNKSAYGRCVDLSQLRENVRLIRSVVPQKARLMAVVKADAYGHGACQVARAALEAGASWLAVALPKEGKELREAGIEAPILVLGASCGEDGAMAAQNRLTLTICTPDMVREISRNAAESTVDVHLKLDTGMNRIGARNEAEVKAVLEALHACPNVCLTGAFTHFADADGAEMAFTRTQLERFRALSALLPGGMMLHCANSASIHRLMPEAAFDMVRMGISMYGYPPVQTDLPLRPLMVWRTRVTHVKTISSGDAVSYGCTFRADRPTRVATIACGYGDGYHRACTGKAEVLIHGHRVPVIGRICMDQMMADVSALDDVRSGDTVTLMGCDGAEEITAEELAQWAGTISYEVLLAATGRVDRTWLYE